ncbi:Hypothetical protein PHPALM_8543 [Phytophthora palmivora]|uniref:HAT C-terminal dimerisation domain-containing protein n=1 Tax=Phytophthora palmivora TaxID=4796 RepID=A0A2P4Y9K7_9STRA|nr:Hypothetical protein PHPALM_8543 [Phytophthora palmivora]
MESVTDQLAHFSLGEVQEVGVASSYSLLLRRMISMSLELEYLNRLVLENSSLTRKEFTQRRVAVKLNDFSAAGSRVEMPTENDEVQAVYDDLLMQSCISWNQWKGLVVKWSCSTSTGKYNALQLYREVDILAWFRGIGQVEFPAVAALARIYLGKPLSAAPQERFFSLSSYVVNDLRTCLDEKRVEMMCLMKGNWKEYKELLKEKKATVH